MAARDGDPMLPTSAPPLTPRRSAGLRPQAREAISVVLQSWFSRQFLYGW
jgi:hypothetical protein